jgi:uncharacterized protein (DUF433 family)
MRDLDTGPLALPVGGVFHRDPEIHSGSPVFAGTRVPVQTFIEYLQGGYNIDEFLDHFPSVRRDQAVGFLEMLAQAVLARGARG